MARPGASDIKDVEALIVFNPLELLALSRCNLLTLKICVEKTLVSCNFITTTEINGNNLLIFTISLKSVAEDI